MATVNLLGGLEEQYKVDMCIDHHSTNTEYADLLLLEDVPAACQIMYDVVLALGIEVDKKLQIAFIPALLPIQDVFAMIQQRRKLTVLPPILLKPVPITEE